MDPSNVLVQLAATPCGIRESFPVQNDISLEEKGKTAVVLAEHVYSRDFAKASQLIIKYHDLFQMVNEKQMRITMFDVIFHTGITSFHMARETREAQWIKMGINVVAAFEKWSKKNAWNFYHSYLLLKAELHHTKGETNDAIQAYDMSMAVSTKRNGSFKHHSALAAELAAHFFGNIGAKERSR